MATFKIYHGASQPLTAVGANQCRVLAFAEAFRGWHYVTRSNRRAVEGLERRGAVIVEGERYKFPFGG